MHQLEPGSLLGPYRIEGVLGAGGMGVVYRARDTRLDRQVALKTSNKPFDERFTREARTIASISHPNVCTLYDVGADYLVMELVEGRTLGERLLSGPLTYSEALGIADQLADALEAAHGRGVVHRDLKPANVKITPEGRVKVLDFGLAKVPAASAEAVTVAATVAGFVLGTPAYMAPEQARGEPVDARADIWAFGVLLFEMLTGRSAFERASPQATLVAVLTEEPDWEAVKMSARRLVRRCLARQPADRIRDIGDVRLELRELIDAERAPLAPPDRARTPAREAAGPADEMSRARSTARPNTALVATALLAAGLGAAAVWWLSRDTDAQWLADEALPAIERYLDTADWESAYTLARQAEARVPGSPELADVWTRLSWLVTIESDPPGATVFRQAYDSQSEEWEELGRTPLEDIRVPYGLSRIRFELPGYRSLVRTLGGGHINWRRLETDNVAMRTNLVVGPDIYTLDTEQTLPADMVRVPGWVFRAGDDALELRDFFLGRHEVTNAEYKQFVDAGAYRLASFWDPIVENGAIVPFEEAMRRFVDGTGQRGPSTWEAGDYREGEEGLPVSGVSWYEATAYARFAGRELPTAHHWQQALARSMFPWLIPVSNFGGDGPRSVAESAAMSYVEAFDMAGNVREWTATETADGRRIILGASWNDPYYIAGAVDTSASPMDRSAGNGIRLAMTEDDPPIAEQVRAAIGAPRTDSPVLDRQPVPDEVFAAYGRVFDYDRHPLNAALEATDTTRNWTRERVRFDAAYGTDRMLLYLYLPVGGSPPYQTVVYWPGWDTFWLDDIDEYFQKQLDFVVKSGRAVAFPVFKGTFERRIGDARAVPPFNTVAYRDNTVDTVKDLRRTLDYLETRPEIDSNALALFGYSWGGVNGPVALAHEPRLRLGVIYVGLLPPMQATPEVDPVNALPHVRVPLLMVSGEFDAMVPVAQARRYFELLGTPAADRRHEIAVGGHYVPRADLIGWTLSWLDKYLGQVTPPS